MNNSHEKLRVGMIVLSSKQILPNVMGVTYRGAGLERLCIYHTQNETESELPAQRLQKWMAATYPGVICEMTPQELLQGKESDDSILSESVSGQIRKWIEAHPDLDWVINATGGLKLMSMGVSDLVPEDNGRIDVIYREIATKEWYRLKRMNGCLRSIPASFDRAGSELDLLSVIELHQGQKWVSLKANSHPLAELLKEAEEALWEWNPVMITRKEQGIRPHNRGDGFERWTAAVLKSLGIEDVHCNVALHMTQARNKTESSQETSTVKQAIEENDVLCWHNETLYLFDCKLTNQEDLEFKGEASAAQITEIHDAVSRVRALGGLRTVAVLVRPTRPFTAEHRLVAESLGLKIIDATDNHDFVRKIAGIVAKEELPDDAAAAQEWLDGAKKENRPVIAMKQRERALEEKFGKTRANRECPSIEGVLQACFPKPLEGPHARIYRNGLGLLELCIDSTVVIPSNSDALKEALKKVTGTSFNVTELHRSASQKRTQWKIVASVAPGEKFDENHLVETIYNGTFQAELQNLLITRRYKQNLSQGSAGARKKQPYNDRLSSRIGDVVKFNNPSRKS